MPKSSIVYFSKMFQAVPAIAPVHKKTGGTFVIGRRSTQNAYHKMFPEAESVRYRRWTGSFNQGKKFLNNAEKIVTGSPYREFLKPFHAKKYMIFHGTYMMMSGETTQKLSHFDTLFLTGPRMEQMFSRSNLDVESHTTGFLPFGLFPEKNQTNRSSILKKLGLNPDRKTVIYTPSRDKIGSWMQCAENLVDQVPSEFNLVLRPHPSQALSSNTADKKSYKKIFSKISCIDNAVLDLMTCSLPELLSVADLVISDANSPSEESMFYDVPQLFVETDKFSRNVVIKMGREESMHPEDLDQLLTLYDCGPSTNGNKLWLPIIHNAINNQLDFSSNRQQYFNWVFGARDRNAATRVAQYLLNS